MWDIEEKINAFIYLTVLCYVIIVFEIPFITRIIYAYVTLDSRIL